MINALNLPRGRILIYDWQYGLRSRYLVVGLVLEHTGVLMRARTYKRVCITAQNGRTDQSQASNATRSFTYIRYISVCPGAHPKCSEDIWAVRQTVRVS